MKRNIILIFLELGGPDAISTFIKKRLRRHKGKRIKAITPQYFGNHDGRSFDIDTETMQLKASRDDFPPFISAEK